MAAPGRGPGDTNGGCFVSWARGRPRAMATVVPSPSCHSCGSLFILHGVLSSAVLLLGGSRLLHTGLGAGLRRSVPIFPLLPGWSTNEPPRGARSHPRGRGFVGGNHSPPSLLLGTASHVLPHQTLPGTTPGKTTPQGHPSDPGVPSCWGQRPPRPPPAYPRRNVALPSTFFPFFHILSHAGQGRNGNSAPGRAAPLPAAPPRGRHRGQGTKESSRREASVGASREQHPSTFHGETLDVIRAED